MNIYGRKVILRAMEPKDAGILREMFNDPKMEENVVGWAFPVSQYSQERWLETHFADEKDKRFMIETKEGVSIGAISLMHIDWKNRCAGHGLKIAAKEYRMQGIGTDAVMAIMRYTFDELNLHRLEGCILDNNAVSLALYTKCGWSREGVKREGIYKNGRFHDLIVVGILEQDYRALISKNHYWDSIPEN